MPYQQPVTSPRRVPTIPISIQARGSWQTHMKKKMLEQQKLLQGRENTKTCCTSSRGALPSLHALACCGTFLFTPPHRKKTTQGHKHHARNTNSTPINRKSTQNKNTKERISPNLDNRYIKLVLLSPPRPTPRLPDIGRRENEISRCHLIGSVQLSTCYVFNKNKKKQTSKKRKEKGQRRKVKSQGQSETQQQN